jgi:carbonic anhydrase/acetyltransferase-like protein (isoleucine patch superfamily)
LRRVHSWRLRRSCSGDSGSARSSVRYGSVLRGDEEIVIGEDTHVQDLSMMHADPDFPAALEDRVTVGHRAIVHGRRVRTTCSSGWAPSS